MCHSCTHFIACTTVNTKTATSLLTSRLARVAEMSQISAHPKLAKLLLHKKRCNSDFCTINHSTMSNNYQRIPTSDNDNSTHPEPSTAQDDPSDPSYRPLRASVRAEFERPAPSWWKRALLLFALVLMGWAAVRLGSYGRDTQPKVIYATRSVLCTPLESF